MASALRVLIVVGLMISALVPSARAQPYESAGAEWYASRAQDAIRQERYEAAILLLNEGKKRYPDEKRLGMILGDLYSTKELYGLALSEYESVSSLVPGDFASLYNVATTLGKLNRDRESVAAFERLIALHPDRTEVASDLGWMYFKTYQLKKGEQLLQSTLQKVPISRDIAITLGTIYSGLYDYTNAKKFYEASIEDALGDGNRYFASVGYYNLALLELGFYHYAAAMANTELSLAMQDRAPGRISKGELLEYQMDLGRALSEYSQAYSMDSTPLAKFNLASLYQEMGKLDEAQAYLSSVVSTKDSSWMYYFGTDAARHAMDIYKIQAAIYSGLANTERHSVPMSPLESIRSFFLGLRYSILGWYNLQRYRSFALSVGKDYLNEGDLLDAYWSIYKGSGGYPAVAARYLARARAIELATAPGALPFYEQEEGKTRRSITLLEDSIRDFDPFWERQGIAESLIALAPLQRRAGQAAEARETINRLYELNAGALRQHGLGLPVLLAGDVRPWMARLLRRAGLEVTVKASPGFRYSAVFSVSGGEIRGFSLVDGERGIQLLRKELHLSAQPHENKVRAIREFVDTIYGKE